MANDRTPKVTIWTDTEHVPRIDRVLELVAESIQPIGIGGPRGAAIGDFARRLACRHEDDFRKLLVENPAEFVLLGSTTGISSEDIRLAIQQGSTVLTLEPVAAELSELVGAKTRTAPARPRSTNGGGGPYPIIWTPAFGRSPGWTGAADPNQVLGRPTLINICSFGPPSDGSLFARLFDAWQLALMVGGLPDSIDASLTGPLGEVPDNLRGITGHLAAHGRLPHGCTVTLSISDRAGRLGRTAHVVGDQGHFYVSDTGYRLCDASGNCIDQKTESKHAVDLAELIALDWKNLIHHPVATSAQRLPTTTQTAILGCCLACLLSARTGNPESPQKLLQLHRC